MRNFGFGKEGLRSKRRELEEEKKEFERLRAETDFEKSDFLALTIAALITILPIAVIAFIAIYFIIELMFT